MSVARVMGWVVLAGLCIALGDSILRRKKLRSRRLFALLVALLVLDILALYPIPLAPANVARAAVDSPYLDRPGFPIALVVGNLARGKDFASSDWSYAWANLLEQEFSGFSLVGVASLARLLTQETRFLVISKSVWSIITDDLLQSLGAWVREGGVLIADQPSNAASTLTGVGTGGSWSPNSITWVGGDPPTDILLGLPLNTDCLEILNMDPDCQVMMKMDDRPAVVLRPVALGVVISVLFDLGQQLTAFQQGVPDKGFRILDKRGIRGLLDATDLMLDAALLDCPLPYADVLERWIISTAEEFAVLPRVWYFQYPFDGMVAMTHDEDWFGDESCFVCAQESASNYSSTFFVISRGPITRQGLEAIRKLGGDVQIHWNREMGRWLVIFRKGDGSLKRQIRELQRKLGAAKVSACRIHRLRWGQDYTRPFRVMEAQGIKLDSSLGPAGKKGKGFLFGTGLPFHPIDANGKPFLLYELPFQIQAGYSGADVTYIANLLTQSESAFHHVVTALYHPADLVEGKPTRDDWLAFDELARQHNHALVCLSQLLAWWQVRAKVQIACLSSTSDSGSFLFRSEAEQMAITVPASRGGKAGIVLVDGEPPQEMRETMVQGKNYLVVRIGSGEHNVQIEYR